MSIESRPSPSSSKWKKYCTVPLCTNSSRTAPNKKYFSMPKVEKIRKKWCKAMKHYEKKNVKKLSNISTLFVCEDHFNLEEDLDNYYAYKLMNAQPRLKRGMVPHLFACQKPPSTTSAPPTPTTERICTINRQRQQLVNDIIKEYEELQQVEATASSAVQAEETQTEELANTSDDISVNTVRDVSVQVKIRPHFRSKGVNVKIPPINPQRHPVQNVASDASASPIEIPPQSTDLYVAGVLVFPSETPPMIVLGHNPLPLS